jgi:predicted PurR-regulated permease PerM
MASYFFTADYPYLRIRLFQSMGEESCRVLKQFKRVISAATGGYFKAQILLSSGVFFLLLMGFLAWRQEYAFLLAFGLAVLDFIPLVGAGVVLVPWGVVSAAMGRYGDGIWAVALLSVTAVFRRLAEPKIVGEETGLSPVLSLMSVYVGMNLAGVPGMILGPILTLMMLNLSGLGLFYRLRKDFVFVMEDVFRLFQRD